MSWYDRALCKQMADAKRLDPELFFSEDSRRAKAICAQCPVRLDCLESQLTYEGAFAVSHRFGVFGGLDRNERHALHRERIGRPAVNAA